MGLSRADLTALLDAFEQYGWNELSLSIDGARIELTSSGRPPESQSRSAAGPAAPAPAVGAPPAAAVSAPGGPSGAGAAPQAAAPVAAALPDAGLHEVVAPSVGIFYVAPEPGAPPFAEVGARVAADDIVCVVEVMKLMNHVKAGIGGVVRAVHAENGAMIEHGQTLFTIEPAA